MSEILSREAFMEGLADMTPDALLAHDAALRAENARLRAEKHDGQHCTTERPCCVCEARLAAEAEVARLRVAAWEVVQGGWWGHYCPSCGFASGHGPECVIGRLLSVLAKGA